LNRRFERGIIDQIQIISHFIVLTHFAALLGLDFVSGVRLLF
jgi:hypothetical protein